MKLTNKEIYNNAEKLISFCIEEKMPIKIGFFLQKNIQIIELAAKEIDEARLGIAKRFGELSEDGSSYYIPHENLVIAQNELNDLFSLVQDLNIHIFKLEDFNNIELTYQQLSAIMFMIEE